MVDKNKGMKRGEETENKDIVRSVSEGEEERWKNGEEKGKEEQIREGR